MSKQSQLTPNKHKAGSHHQSPANRKGQPRGSEQMRQGWNSGHGQQQQNLKTQAFEPYWPQEQVGEAIKRGELIVGPVRINPRNYEDAYVPLPDGSVDLFIGGMKNRNRALNADVVVVSPFPYEEWRVFVEDFELFEKTRTSTSRNNRHGATDCDLKGDAAAVLAKSGNDSDDSGPDVIFEDDSDDDVRQKTTKEPGGALEGACGSGEHSGSDKAKGTDAIVNTLRDMALSKESSAASSRSGNRADPSTPIKKFASVSEMMKYGSPFAKNLFGQGPDGPASVRHDKGGKFLQPTGKVVFIYERKHSLAASGSLKVMSDKNKNLALFSPSDSRVPRMVIPMVECPKNFAERPGDYSNTLYIARIVQWDDTAKMPKGCLARSIGEAGQIEPETEAMLIAMDVDDTPFSDMVLECLPSHVPWTIPQSEFGYRKDFRNTCVFTIDPATARDLDDAVSIEELPDGRFQVGVHIADVSFFVPEDTALDEVAAKRATSVYLVQKVVPMLPRRLCEELCSLNPAEDRLTFSVLWTINEQGEIFDEWYGRSVIRSCVKLSYEHAQGFLEEPEREWTQAELPPITSAFCVKDVMDRVIQLNKIAVNLRKQRFDNGALRLDQVKLQYSLDTETGLPNGYSVYQGKDSNRLIEEFMLLANMAVAHKIKNKFPDKAVLRRHPPPQTKPLEMMVDLCESYGLHINATSSGELQRSLLKYYADDEFSQARLQVLVNMASRPMQNAKYFCSGSLPDETMYHHYALNVPLYTHFTSPIRRYPDIMVHRLLAASLGYCEDPEKSTDILHRQADYCNDKKTNAKMASDRSLDMYFSIFVKEAGPLEEMGMVMSVLDKAFDVLILKLGVTKRVYMDKLPLVNYKFRKNMKCPELLLEWTPQEGEEGQQCSTIHLITLFTMVDCIAFSEKGPLQWTCIIKRPIDEIK